jgi:hypothetical protein
MIRPKVTTRCVANQYAGRDERIIEFDSNDGHGRGGLISFRRNANGALIVSLYRLGRHGDVQVNVSPACDKEPE